MDLIFDFYLVFFIIVFIAIAEENQKVQIQDNQERGYVLFFLLI